MHPKEAEHKKLCEERKQKELRQRQLLKELTNKHRLRFVHLRRINYTPDGDDFCKTVLPKGGMTLAYQLPKRGRGNIIRVSTALVHENDAYCKWVGRFHAAVGFTLGNHVMLRVPRNMPASAFLKDVFEHAAY